MASCDKDHVKWSENIHWLAFVPQQKLPEKYSIELLKCHILSANLNLRGTYSNWKPMKYLENVLWFNKHFYALAKCHPKISLQIPCTFASVKLGHFRPHQKSATHKRLIQRCRRVLLHSPLYLWRCKNIDAKCHCKENLHFEIVSFLQLDNTDVKLAVAYIYQVFDTK